MKKSNSKKTKAKNENKAAERKPKQTEIPGTERKRIPEFDGLAEKFREVRDEWMSLGLSMAESKEELHDAMKKHGVAKYRYLDDEGDEEEAFVEDTVKVGVRKVKSAKAKADE